MARSAAWPWVTGPGAVVGAHERRPRAAAENVSGRRHVAAQDDRAVSRCPEGESRSPSRAERPRVLRGPNWLSSSVSNQCNVEVSAALQSHRVGEPIRRNVGSVESRAASFRSASRLSLNVST